jgi:cytochrome c oxidase subunit 4
MNDHHSTSHGHDSHDHGDHGHGDHGHHPGLGLYLYIFVALCVLTSASFFTYSDAWPFHHPGQEWVGWTFMMAVSCTKAMLVILFFMHLKWEANWKWVLTVPASLMSVLLVLALIPDVALRYMDTWHSGPSRQRLTYAADLPTSQPNHEHNSAGVGAPKGAH